MEGEEGTNLVHKEKLTKTQEKLSVTCSDFSSKKSGLSKTEKQTSPINANTMKKYMYFKLPKVKEMSLQYCFFDTLRLRSR